MQLEILILQRKLTKMSDIWQAAVKTPISESGKFNLLKISLILWVAMMILNSMRARRASFCKMKMNQKYIISLLKVCLQPIKKLYHLFNGEIE